MHIQIIDVLTILVAIGPIIGVYVVLKRDVATLKVTLAIASKEIEKLEQEISHLKIDHNRENRETWKKLAAIEAAQLETNVYLKENLKRLTDITARLADEVDNLENKVERKFEQQEHDIRRFYENYDVKKK